MYMYMQLACSQWQSHLGNHAHPIVDDLIHDPLDSNSTQIWLDSPFDLIQCYQMTWLFMNCLNLFTEDSFLYVLNRYWSSKYIVSSRHCCQCEHGYQWKYSRLDYECLWHCWWCRRYHLLDWNQCWHSRSEFRGHFWRSYHTGDMQYIWCCREHCNVWLQCHRHRLVYEGMTRIVSTMQVLKGCLKSIHH